VEGRPWATALIFLQTALRSAPIVGIGLFDFEIISAGYRMNLPMNVAKIAIFYEEHPNPNDIIKGSQSDLDLMNKIVREHILENQKEMKLAFDEKVTGNPAAVTEDTEVPDDEVMYEARCILKQMQRKGGQRQFLVKWADESVTDSWCNEDDVSDALLAHWFIMHNQKGLNLALIGMPGPWACRRWWEERSPPRVEKVDQYGSEL